MGKLPFKEAGSFYVTDETKVTAKTNVIHFSPTGK